VQEFFYILFALIMMKNELSNLFVVLNYVVFRKYCGRLELDEIMEGGLIFKYRKTTGDGI